MIYLIYLHCMNYRPNTHVDLGSFGTSALEQLSKHLGKSKKQVLFELVVNAHTELGLVFDPSILPKSRKKAIESDPSQVDMWATWTKEN